MKNLLYVLCIISVAFSCSVNTLEDNCSPNSVLETLNLNDEPIEYNVVYGSKNNNLDNDFKTFFATLDYDRYRIYDLIDGLVLKENEKESLYSIDLFFVKNDSYDKNPIGSENLVSAIIHYLDNNDYLRVKYFLIDKNSLREVDQVRSIAPFVSGSASYDNFLYLKNELGIITNNYIFTNSNIQKPKRSNTRPFSNTLSEYHKKKLDNDYQLMQNSSYSSGCYSPCNENGPEHCETSGDWYKCGDHNAGVIICSAKTISYDLKEENQNNLADQFENLFPDLYSLKDTFNNNQKGESYQTLFYDFSRLINNGSVSISINTKIGITNFVLSNTSLISSYLNDPDSDILYNNTKRDQIIGFLNNLKAKSSNTEWETLFDSLISEVSYYSNKTIGYIKADFNM